MVRGTKRRMSVWLYSSPPHGSVLQADGHGEVWSDSGLESKFKQYGWRCTTNEDSYSNKTLMGNWNQERFDLRKLEERKPLPSQYDHYYQTTYSCEYPKMNTVTRVLKKEPHVFPGHQPELIPPEYRTPRKSCYTIDYGSHCLPPRVPCNVQEDQGLDALKV
ncbi:cilia- and flagella-associated protein 68 [Rhinophrynus dorsalis]